jgi:hypothetical protein
MAMQIAGILGDSGGLTETPSGSGEYIGGLDLGDQLGKAI